MYALAGRHTLMEDDRSSSLQDLINLVAGSDNLQFFAFQPSLHQRGIQKDQKMNAVLDIGIAELGQLLFYPPQGVQAGHQRVIFF